MYPVIGEKKKKKTLKTSSHNIVVTFPFNMNSVQNPGHFQHKRTKQEETSFGEWVSVYMYLHALVFSVKKRIPKS
jgi:hypothetical protein